MNSAAARACLCGCGQKFDRPRSFPICKAASVRVYAVIRRLAPDDLNERQRISNYVWRDERTVSALLAGDLAEVERRVRFRAEHGLYADPDRVLAVS